MPNKTMPGKLQIEIPDTIVEGIYANLVIIAHSPSEFVLDFVRMVPGAPKAKVQTRVIMTPLNTKNLIRALKENIDKFEKRFGDIKVENIKEDRTIGFSTEE